MSQRVVCNPFVKRQTAESRFSHFDGSWEMLEDMVQNNFTMARPGDKAGSILISVNPSGFFSGIVGLNKESKLTASFEARRDGEMPFINVVVQGKKQPAAYVDVVLYKHDILGADASSDAEWEIICINARMTFAPEPTDPVTMMRNFLELPGGTKAVYTAEEFARAILFWSQNAMKAP